MTLREQPRNVEDLTGPLGIQRHTCDWEGRKENREMGYGSYELEIPGDNHMSLYHKWEYKV